MPAKKSTALDAEAFAQAIGDPDLALFYISWLRNGMNATKAYEELHPNVTHGSAEVLGARQLGKVRRDAIMAAYKLGHERYFKQLDAGLTATKWNDFTGEREEDHNTRDKYHTKLGKILGIEQNATTLIQVNNDMKVEFSGGEQ